ncbi:aminopeptidase N [Streptomyces sp. NPDC008125]|uniref:aminopeptidase N n=1 Tax=Streptomyces sp. NPDC008125 TaxID=3364811 RepID=UPI0036EB2871
MAGNLTLEEARHRAGLLRVDSYRVELDLTGGAETFRSVTTVRFGCRSPGAGTFLELADAEVLDIVLNGEPLDARADGGRIALPVLREENEVRVVADCRYSRSGEGLHRFVDPVDGRTYLYSQFATADAHRVFACFDQPDLKAVFELSVVVPEEWEVASATVPERSGPVAVPGTTAWNFPASLPLPTYAFAVVAGPYHVVTDRYRGPDGVEIPLRILCRASLAGDLDHDALFGITRNGFRFFQDLFATAYPFEKYDQVFAPEFNLGAMENAACVTVNEKYVFGPAPAGPLRERRAETLLHEMAHMWFGDLVTMAWWDDLWLNESFATWAGVLAQSETTEWTGAWTTFATLRKTEAYRQDQLPSTHPIAADIPDVAATEVNFDGITYLKGASAIKQLVSHVGRANFVEGVRRYVRRHAWRNTRLVDLLSALEETSGRDLGAWSEEWLETAGVNTLRLEYTCDDQGVLTSCAVLQEAPAAHPVTRSHRVAVGLYGHSPEGLVRHHRVELDVRGERTEVAALVGLERPALLLLNDDDLTYAKVRLDAHSLRGVLEGGSGQDGGPPVAAVRDPLAAALVWSILWDMTRDGELPARKYVSLVADGLPHVTDPTLAQALHDRALKAVREYVAPSWRARGLAELAGVSLALVRRSEPGSELCLVHLRAFVHAARSSEHMAELSRLLDGDRLDDAELRWTVLRRLVALGERDGPAVDAECLRDPSAAGERHAAACRAAIPTVRAKAEAWRRILSGELAGGTFWGTLEGFCEPGHHSLPDGYDTAYFEVVGRVWEELAGGRALRFAREAFPAASIGEATVAAAQARIDRPGTPAALRRVLAEGRSDLLRALRAQRTDATMSTNTLANNRNGDH